MSNTIKQAIDGFLLSCKVEGKSYGTIECYSDKLKGFLWYAIISKVVNSIRKGRNTEWLKLEWKSR